MSDRDRISLARRRFAKLAVGGALAAPLARSSSAQAAQAAPTGFYLPPPGAEELTSACAFCIVGCGYRIFRWPVDGPSGGPGADENALGLEFPTARPDPWISPSMHNIVNVDGELHHVVVVPDWKSTVVNKGGDHSLGGVLARRLYSPLDDSTHDRFLQPQLRVGGRLVPIEWAEAAEIVAKVGRHVIDTHGELAWGLKTYSYQFYENTYAITKLAFSETAVNTPCWAPHDQPRSGDPTAGLSTAGIDAFSAAYQDWADADVVLLSGVAVYEARAVLFNQWVSMAPRDALVDGEGKPHKALVVINPRCDVAAEWAERNGGIHLQLRPGTDTVLNNAIARVILERGWHDEEFIERHTVSDDELEDEVTEDEEGDFKPNPLRVAYGMTFASWREMILADDRYALSEAAQTTGVSEEAIERAAALLAAPRPDKQGTVRRPRTSAMLEKGNYWSHGFPNAASFASLALLVGAGNRPGQVVSRGGGHQRGMMQAAKYPTSKSPHTLAGRTVALNLDHWAFEGNLRFAWAIGCTWAGGGAAAAGPLFLRLRELTRETGPQLDEATAFPAGLDGGLDVQAVIASLTARADAGGMVLVQQDLYPQSLTELADVVLPATSWGEGSFTRMQGERRLRHYAQICDPPGQARDDWRIVADVARRMGYAGFDWETAAEVFTEAAQASSGVSDYKALVEHAASMNRSAHEVLAEYGTKGLQCPLRMEGGELRETLRVHDAQVWEDTDGERGRFNTRSGKALFVHGSWDDAVERQEALAPREGELWVINRRDSRVWSGMIEDRRIPQRMAQMPENVLEMNVEDAAPLLLRDGDRVLVRTDHVSVTEGGWRVSGSSGFYATVEVSECMAAGVTCAYFNYLGDVQQTANNVVSNTTDPINGMYSFKLGRGVVEKVEQPDG